MNIAVVIPIHGRVKLLSSCLESLNQQSHRPAEIIVVDDGNSRPDELEICRIVSSYSASVIRIETRVGAAAARNYGAQRTSSELLFFCDADVILEQNALERLHGALILHPNAAYAYGDYIIGGIFGSHTMRAQIFDRAILYDHNFISTMSLVRRTAFYGFDESMNRFQDWDLWLTIAERNGEGVYAPGIIFTAAANGSMSVWLPSFCIRNAKFFMWLPAVRQYVLARKRLFEKWNGARSVR